MVVAVPCRPPPPPDRDRLVAPIRRPMPSADNQSFSGRASVLLEQPGFHSGRTSQNADIKVSRLAWTVVEVGAGFPQLTRRTARCLRALMPSAEPPTSGFAMMVQRVKALKEGMNPERFGGSTASRRTFQSVGRAGEYQTAHRVNTAQPPAGVGAWRIGAGGYLGCRSGVRCRPSFDVS
jgi:hypothetical protein